MIGTPFLSNWMKLSLEVDAVEEAESGKGAVEEDVEELGFLFFFPTLTPRLLS